MSYFKKLLKQSSFYLSSHILTMLAGFISFPIWTRIFSKAEYGILHLITITVLFLTAFSKLGLQHAAIRFFPEFEKRQKNMSSYYATLFLSSFILNVFIFLLANVLIWSFSDSFHNKLIINLLHLSTVLIFIDSLKSIFENFLRAESKAKIYALLNIFNRYSRLFLSLIFVVVFVWGLFGFFLGWILASIFMLVILFFMYLKKGLLNTKSYTFPFLKEAITYGFPLIAIEIANMLLNFGDRYLIQYFLGASYLGTYAAGYNMSNLVISTISNPLRLAVVPLFISIWEKKGAAETKHFLTSIFNFYLMIIIPIIFGSCCLRKEIIIIMASSKYFDAATIIPYIVTSKALHGILYIFGAGLYVKKKTSFLMWLTLVSSFINVILNLFLIPKYGITGAAFSTLICIIFLSFSTYMISRKFLKIDLARISLLRYLFLSFLMYLAIIFIPGMRFIEVLGKIALGAMIYLVGLIITDEYVRKKICIFLKVS